MPSIFAVPWSKASAPTSSAPVARVAQAGARPWMMRPLFSVAMISAPNRMRGKTAPAAGQRDARQGDRGERLEELAGVRGGAGLADHGRDDDAADRRADAGQHEAEHPVGRRSHADAPGAVGVAADGEQPDADVGLGQQQPAEQVDDRDHEDRGRDGQVPVVAQPVQVACRAQQHRLVARHQRGDAGERGQHADGGRQRVQAELDQHRVDQPDEHADADGGQDRDRRLGAWLASSFAQTTPATAAVPGTERSSAPASTHSPSAAPKIAVVAEAFATSRALFSVKNAGPDQAQKNTTSASQMTMTPRVRMPAASRGAQLAARGRAAAAGVRSPPMAACSAGGEPIISLAFTAARSRRSAGVMTLPTAVGSAVMARISPTLFFTSWVKLNATPA